MNETVVIIGTASTISITPWDLPGVDYWACAPVITHPPHKGHRIDKIFEMHNINYWTTIQDRVNKYVAENPQAEIVMHDKYDAIKNSVKYPLSEIQSFINHPRMRGYFTSTIAYMVALALYMGYKKIELYGVHMASGEEEYSMQRSCVEALLAFGWGRGVNFYLPDESDVMKSTYLYGYQQENGFLLRCIKEKQGLEAGVNDLEKKLKKMEQDFWMQKGAATHMTKYVNDLKKQGLQ